MCRWQGDDHVGCVMCRRAVGPPPFVCQRTQTVGPPVVYNGRVNRDIRSFYLDGHHHVGEREMSCDRRPRSRRHVVIGRFEWRIRGDRDRDRTGPSRVLRIRNRFSPADDVWAAAGLVTVQWAVPTSQLLTNNYRTLVLSRGARVRYQYLALSPSPSVVAIDNKGLNDWCLASGNNIVGTDRPASSVILIFYTSKDDRRK